MSVQLPSSLRSFRTEIVRSPCGDRLSHGARAGIVQCHLGHVYGLRSYDFSKFVKLLAKPNRRGRGARESVRKSHSHLLPSQGGLAGAARKRGYGQDTGSVDPSHAKCELGIMPSSHLPRTPCDKFVYDFPYDFLGIVGGYGLRHMCCIRASCNFFYGASGGNPG